MNAFIEMAYPKVNKETMQLFQGTHSGTTLLSGLNVASVKNYSHISGNLSGVKVLQKGGAAYSKNQIGSSIVMMPQANYNNAPKALVINSNQISTMQANTVEQPLTARGGQGKE